MPTRRVGTSRRAKRTNANTRIVTRAARGVRRLVKTPPGSPSPRMLQGGTNSYRRIRTLMKRAPADGLAQPEARQAMLTSQSIVAGGVKVSGGAPAGGTTIVSKEKMPRGGVTKVRPPRLGPLKRRGNAT